MKAAARLLVEAGIVREEGKKREGRPSDLYLANPKLWDA